MSDAEEPRNESDSDPSMPVAPTLGMWDAVSIIVGIVVGTAIFKSSTMVFNNVSGPWAAMAVWLSGGVLSLIGALCYAELATTYPRSGGDFHYLTKAFGRMFGFLFGWAQLSVILTGSIAIMAYAFADYAGELLDLEKLAAWINELAGWGGPVSTELADEALKSSAEVAATGINVEILTVILAIAAVVFLSGMNVLGVMIGKVVQNILSVVKILGLVGIVIAGLVFASNGALTKSTRGTPADKTDTVVVDDEAPVVTDGASAADETDEASNDDGEGEATIAAPAISLGLAMVFVLYAFGGWNDAAFVAAEVRGRRRNLPLALLLGVGIITTIYLLVIYAYMAVLGFEGARETFTPASAVMVKAVGPWGGKVISLLVMISALGAINGLILTGSRVYASLGTEHRIFGLLGRWDQQRGAPIASLVTQCLICVLLIVAVGTELGRTKVDRTLEFIGASALPWEDYFGGFETLVSGTAPVFWGFFLMTGIAFFVLREHDGDRPRPFRTPLFPITPIIFCCMCGYMLYSSLAYAKGLAILGLLPLAIGVPLYLISDWGRVKTRNA